MSSGQSKGIKIKKFYIVYKSFVSQFCVVKLYNQEDSTRHVSKRLRKRYFDENV